MAHIGIKVSGCQFALFASFDYVSNRKHSKECPISMIIFEVVKTVEFKIKWNWFSPIMLSSRHSIGNTLYPKIPVSKYLVGGTIHFCV